MGKVGNGQMDFKQSDFKHWKLLKVFNGVLDEVLKKQKHMDKTWKDKRRKLELSNYLSLFLFGLYNPVVKTMRGLSQASQLTRVQDEISKRPVSLGSFSEAQSVVDVKLLELVFKNFDLSNSQHLFNS